MSTAVWIRALALTAVMVSACTTTPTVGSAPSPTVSSAPASPSQTPTSANLALVTLKGSSSWVVRDLTDINHPKTVSNLGAISGPVFVSGTEISYALDTKLYRAPLAGSPKTLSTAAPSGLQTPAPPWLVTRLTNRDRN